MSKVRLVIVGGFLGAGKTTALIWLAHALEATGYPCAVVTNDQGEQLVDTALGRARELAVAEVTGGCFCCRFDELVGTSIDLIERCAVDIVLAEAVGSCTDLTATVIRPLRAYFGERFEVAPLAVFVEPARLRELRGANEAGPLMAYLFDKQLEDAQLLVLTKLDMVGRSAQAELVSGLEQRYPAAEVLCVSARTGDGMPALRDRLLGAPGSLAGPGVRSIDYTIYAEAEAELAWLNAEARVRAGGGQSAYPVEWLRTFTAAVTNHCAARQLWIGHVKAHLATATGGSKASVLRAGQSPSVDLEDPRPFLDARLLVNARVRARPDDLEDIVRTSLALADDRQRTRSIVTSLRSFRPPPPRPTHRLGPP